PELWCMPSGMLPVVPPSTSAHDIPQNEKGDPMLTTRTGNFPIGARQGWTPWQKDIATFAEWCKSSGLGVVDVAGGLAACEPVHAAGLNIGSADLLAWKQLLSPDQTVRAQAVAQNIEFLQAAAQFGVKNFFTVMLPEKPELPRAENFKYMVEGYAAL